VQLAGLPGKDESKVLGLVMELPSPEMGKAISREGFKGSQRLQF
jgi:hypothetical protein